MKAETYFKLVQSLHVLAGAPGGGMLQGLAAFLPFKEMGATEQLFFSKALSSFPGTYMPVPHLLPTCRRLVRGAVVFSSVAPRKACLADSGLGSCREEQLMHRTGAARGFGVSRGCCIVSGPCSELLLTPSPGEKKGRGISVLTYMLLPKYSLPPFGTVYRRRW